MKIQRKKPIRALFEKMKRMLVTERGSTLKIRMYLDMRLVDQKYYNCSLEEYFDNNGEVATTAHIEVALPNGIWPYDIFNKKNISEKKSLTSGLNNLGNSNL